MSATAALVVVTLLQPGPAPLTPDDLLAAGMVRAAADLAARGDPDLCVKFATRLEERAGIDAAREARSLLLRCGWRATNKRGTAERLRNTGATRAAERMLAGTTDARALRTRLALLIDAAAWDEVRALEAPLRAAGALDDEARHALAYASLEVGAFDDAEALVAPITTPPFLERANELRAAVAQRRADAPLVLARHPDPVDEAPAAAEDTAPATVAPKAEQAAAPAQTRTAELDDIVVRAPHIITDPGSVAEERDGQQVAEVLSAQDMKRAGDGDAASALKRATGITLIGGRYVTVRGLGERYASTTLDGGALPSPEPERRVVPLDLFPTGALSGVAVQKTWSPELSGEFGGGQVQLRSLRQPTGPFFGASVGVGMQGGTTFVEAPRAAGGSLDALGIDDGTRALPDDLRAASESHPIAEKNALTGKGYAAEELERLGESLQRVYTPRSETLPPNLSLALNAGTLFDTPVGALGVSGAAGYGQDWLHQRIERTTLVVDGDGKLTPYSRGVSESGNRNVSLGGVGTASLDLFGHALTATTLVQRVTDDEATILNGQSGETGLRVRTTRINFVERTVASQRLSGLHPLPTMFGFSPALEWRYAYALGLMHQPDQRDVRADEDPQSGRMLLSDRPEGNQRMFSDVTDHLHDAALIARLPLPVWLDQEATFKSGLAASARFREVDTRRYKLLHKGPMTGDPALRARAPEDIFTTKNIGKDGFLLGETTRPTDNYTGETQIGAAFVQAEVPVALGLVATGGARLEAMHMNVRTFALFAANDEAVDAVLDTIDVMPALALTWDLAEPLDVPVQLRAAGSRTVSRPEMRELSPAVFVDVTGGRSRFGNPDVKPAAILHGDLRAEWYPNDGDVFALGLFGKHFTDPIETVITSGSDQAITVENAAGARTVGVEAEAKKGLGFVHRWVAPVSLGVNGALIHSQVTLPKDGIHTSKERALEGQSPWIGNAQVAWDDDDLGTHAAVLYNVSGPRIVEVGVLGAPDVIEEAQHQLDLVLSQQVWAGPWGAVSLTAKGQNLIDLPQERSQGGLIVQRVQRGRSVQLSLSFSL